MSPLLLGTMTEEKVTCVFCGREGTTEDDNFIRGVAGHYICCDCIDSLVALRENQLELEEYSQAEDEAALEDFQIPTPSEIKQELDKKVIGQDRAKKILSIAAYNYYKRLKMTDEYGNCPVEKSNILLIGPTGTGKTYLTETLAEIMGVPFATVDITAFSETGYKGSDPTEVIKTLFYKTMDPDLTEQGIVFIDEIDKIADSGTGGSKVSDAKVQQGLLKIIEGTDVVITANREEEVVINTKNILFICSGAFVGLDEIVRKRICKNSVSIGFGAKRREDLGVDEVLAQTLPEDLFAFGMAPELVGRLHNIAVLKELKKEDLKRIVTEPDASAFNQYKKLFEFDGITLEIEKAALEEIADRCLLNKTGARGIRSVIENIMLEPSFELPSMDGKYDRCIITADAVKGLSKVKYKKKRKNPSAGSRKDI